MCFNIDKTVIITNKDNVYMVQCNILNMVSLMHIMQLCSHSRHQILNTFGGSPIDSYYDHILKFAPFKCCITFALINCASYSSVIYVYVYIYIYDFAPIFYQSQADTSE